MLPLTLLEGDVAGEGGLPFLDDSDDGIRGGDKVLASAAKASGGDDLDLWQAGVLALGIRSTLAASLLEEHVACLPLLQLTNCWLHVGYSDSPSRRPPRGRLRLVPWCSFTLEGAADWALRCCPPPSRSGFSSQLRDWFCIVETCLPWWGIGSPCSSARLGAAVVVWPDSSIQIRLWPIGSVVVDVLCACVGLGWQPGGGCLSTPSSLFFPCDPGKFFGFLFFAWREEG
ncbi:unnamed protein product [Urochloa humidicola]